MISMAKVPRLDAAAAERLALERFGICGHASVLPSERDQNFRINAADGTSYVLKIANGGESRAMLEAETAVMRHLATTGLAPTPVPTSSGEDIADNGGNYVRMITWLPGRPFGMTRRRSEALLHDLGRGVGEITKALATFDHPALHRQFHWNLAEAPALISDRLSLVSESDLRQLLQSTLRTHADLVEPILPSLRVNVIHGDANDYNVLVDPRSQRVTGIVDFGDMVFSHAINDLAIAMAYAALGTPDPVGTAGVVAAGCHAVRPLSDEELAVLYGLMCLRLSLSVCVAATQQAERPGVDYLGISQSPIRQTLPKLAAVHPRLAEYRFRSACGLTPVHHSPAIVEWLRGKAGQFSPITEFDLRTAPVLGVDMSAGSPLVASDPADNAPGPLTERILKAMQDARAVVGAGGYDEARLVYGPDAFAIAGSDERRTVHLGIDLTLRPGSPIHAPLDGTIHGFEDAGPGDYGPVVVLRHEIPGAEPLIFYTLYGHLERRSLTALKTGQRLRAGEPFAAIGEPSENGVWWPHVHFQIITDMLDVPCNFDGVAAASQRAAWLSLSPDPNLILGIPTEKLPQHQTTAQVLESRQRHFGRNVRLSYGSQPLHAVRGWMQYLYDDTGRRYVDAYNNVPHVGHSHPRVTEAAAAHLRTLNTNSRYVHEIPAQYAEELIATLPSQLSVCFFTASGSEANELALRLARAHTSGRDVIVLAGAYHGHTTTLIDISPFKHEGPGGHGAPDWVHAAPLPDLYRGKYRSDDRDAFRQYAREVGGLVDAVRERGGALCAFIAETCPSVGGQIVLPEGYLPEVYRLVRAAGGVCIADEVQTGLGRLGTHFWAFEAHGVIPDIVVLGKPIANGYPMGAVITTAEIAASFDNGMEFFSTFGGSTAACAAALETLRVTIAEGLQAHALHVGARISDQLRRLQEGRRLVGDVRGSGLYLGVELVKDRQLRTPASEEAGWIAERMRELGVLVGTDGPDHNVIKIRGPMSLTATDADRIVTALDQALAEAEEVV